jgi:hypothetical protein
MSLLTWVSERQGGGQDEEGKEGWIRPFKRKEDLNVDETHLSLRPVESSLFPLSMACKNSI